ncbi:hypothetical protein [Spiroplasma endosymbiont of Sarcophaga carnaria]|uniref:hypothetical protein n=1 Tax=Spiroplasma endosymbiont of Sarcophaga carnaria TaxID=3066303 RepID=UPI0030CF124D
MKKLLSLLSVLTISGTAVPTTIAASPYQKEEILNRVKRSLNNINISNVPAIRQTQPYWCGPTIGEAILRYLGLRSVHSQYYTHPDFPNLDQTHEQFQGSLSSWMNTDFFGGTSPQNWTNGINQLINIYNLNNGRLYSTTGIGYFDYHTSNAFYNIVSYSLENNTPVAFAYHGSNNINESDHSHFILITGVRNGPTNPIYTYMNPGTGQYSEFNSSNLVTYLTPGFRTINPDNQTTPRGYLISYTGGNQSWNYEQMDVGAVKKDLRNVIKNADLGSLNNNQDSTILNAVKRLNVSLDTSDISVSRITDTSADINGFTSYSDSYNSNKYKDYKRVYFTVRQPISNVITNTQLGSLDDNNLQTILSSVKRLNVSLDTSDISVSRITDTSADINGFTSYSDSYNSNKYKDYKRVYFTVEEPCSFKKYVANHITWKNLIPGYGFYNMFKC